jgi:hypothetical protein
MMKKYHLRLIKTRRSYSFKEAAELLGTHVRTVQSWRKQGLKVIEGAYPYLVLGSELKAFLGQRQSLRKTKLKSNELYCVACKKAVVPVDVKTVANNRIVGKNKQSITLKGVCPHCGNPVNRFGSRPLPETPKAPAAKAKIKSNSDIDLPLFNPNYRSV